MRSGAGAIAGALLAAAAVGVAAGADDSVRVPKLRGMTRTHAEQVLRERGLRYKTGAPSRRYEPAAGSGPNAGRVFLRPERGVPDRRVTGQEPPPGLRVPRRTIVEFTTSRLPNRQPGSPTFVYALRSAGVGADGRTVTLGVGGRCSPLDHVDVAPRGHWILATVYVNDANEPTGCRPGFRKVSFDLGQPAGRRPILEGPPERPRRGLEDQHPTRWNGLRKAVGGRYAVVYFSEGGCDVLSRTRVSRRGRATAVTIFEGHHPLPPDVACPASATAVSTLVRIPHALMGRPIVDGARQR